MKVQKILVAAPTYDIMKYCEEEFINSLKIIDYPDYSILIVDNSQNNDYFNHLKSKFQNIIVIKDNTKEEKNILRLISSRNKIIKYALENNYDYILMMDSDVIPPKNILKELLLSNKDIVSGLYYNYFNINNKLTYAPVAWTSLTPEEFREIKSKIQLPSFIKSHLDLRVHLTEEQANSNNLFEVLIPSAGCMLIKKEVFSLINYTLLDTSEQNNIKTGDEIGFLLNARKNGFQIYCNTKIKCKHLIKGKFKQEHNKFKHPLYD